MGASAVTVLALILVPAAMSSASPTTDTFYAYPQGTGTDCTSNTFSTSDCDLTEALVAAAASTADTVYVYLEATGTSNEFVNEAPDIYLTGSSQITIEPSTTLSGNTVIDGSGAWYGNGILTLNGTSTGSVAFNDITFQNGYNGGLGNTFGGALSMQATFDVTINNCEFLYNEALGNGGAISFNEDEDGGNTLTVENSTFTSNTADDGNGGAIDNADNGSSTLDVSDSTFTYNVADQQNGGAIDSGDNGGDGSLMVTGSTFENNQANANEIDSNGLNNLEHTNYGDGGAIDIGDEGGTGTLGVTTSTLEDNQAYNNGGAIDEGDYGGSVTATLDTTNVVDNQSGADGGAIDSGDGENGVDAGSGDLMVTNSTLNGNVAYNCGGAIDSGDGGATISGTDVSTLGVTDSTLSYDTTTTGAGGAINSGDGRNTDDTLTVSGSNFEGDQGGDYGGAIANADDYGQGGATISDSTFSLDNSNNNGEAGGAISNATYNGEGDMEVFDSTFDQNGNNGTVGGAIANDVGGFSDDGDLLISGSTFDNNSAYAGGAIANAFQASGSSDQGGVEVIDSTLENNSATDGGAVSNGYQATGNLLAGFASIYSTFADNTASEEGGTISNGFQNGTGAEFDLFRTTVDAGDGTAPALYNRQHFYVAGSVIQGSASALCASHINGFTSDGYNVEQDASSCSFTQSTDTEGLNASLEPLATNGGTTLSEAPPAGSALAYAIPVDFEAAYGSGTIDICPNPDVDQTGNSYAERCTIGSVDVPAPIVAGPPVTTTTLPTTTTTSTSTSTTTTTQPPTTTTTQPAHHGTTLTLNVYFANNSTVLTTASQKALANFVSAVERDDVRSISIRGYADPKGSLVENQKLGTLRASVVFDYLTSLFFSRHLAVLCTVSSGGVLHKYANLALDRVVVIKG